MMISPATASTLVEPAGLQALAGQAVLVAQALAGASGDLVLVVDDAGQILAAIPGECSPACVAQASLNWPGRSWADAVAPDSKGKVGRMLDELAQTGQARRREVNALCGTEGPPTALACRAIRLGLQGPSLVLGRDLGAQTGLQQRFLAAQGQLEAGYWRMRDRLSDY